MLHCCLNLVWLALPSAETKEGHLRPVVQGEGGVHGGAELQGAVAPAADYCAVHNKDQLQLRIVAWKANTLLLTAPSVLCSHTASFCGTHCTCTTFCKCSHFCWKVKRVKSKQGRSNQFCNCPHSEVHVKKSNLRSTQWRKDENRLFPIVPPLHNCNRT